MFCSTRNLSFLIVVTLSLLAAAGAVLGQEPKTVPYLKLTAPRRVLPDAQKWEGNEFPHTMSVLELKRDGFRYWGWYGLNEGRGIGLARSNDLVTWTKYDQNPLWTNARWPPFSPVLTRSMPMCSISRLPVNTTPRAVTLCWPLRAMASI